MHSTEHLVDVAEHFGPQPPEAELPEYFRPELQTDSALQTAATAPATTEVTVAVPKTVADVQPVARRRLGIRAVGPALPHETTREAEAAVEPAVEAPTPETVAPEITSKVHPVTRRVRVSRPAGPPKPSSSSVAEGPTFVPEAPKTPVVGRAHKSDAKETIVPDYEGRRKLDTSERDSAAQERLENLQAQIGAVAAQLRFRDGYGSRVTDRIPQMAREYRIAAKNQLKDSGVSLKPLSEAARERLEQKRLEQEVRRNTQVAKRTAKPAARASKPKPEQAYTLHAVDYAPESGLQPDVFKKYADGSWSGWPLSTEEVLEAYGHEGDKQGGRKIAEKTIERTRKDGTKVKVLRETVKGSSREQVVKYDDILAYYGHAGDTQGKRPSNGKILPPPHKREAAAEGKPQSKRTKLAGKLALSHLIRRNTTKKPKKSPQPVSLDRIQEIGRHNSKVSA